LVLIQFTINVTDVDLELYPLLKAIEPTKGVERLETFTHIYMLPSIVASWLSSTANNVIL